MITCRWSQPRVPVGHVVWGMSQAELQRPAGAIRSARRAAHRYLAAILRGSPHTEFHKCSGLPGTGPWAFSAPLRPGKNPQRCDRRAPAEFRARWAFREFVAGKRRSGGEVVAKCTSEGTAALLRGWMTVAFQSEIQQGAAAFWTLSAAAVKLFALFGLCQRGFVVFYYCKLCAYLHSPRPT